jgi:hypothetical protein
MKLQFCLLFCMGVKCKATQSRKVSYMKGAEEEHAGEKGYLVLRN